MRSCIYCGKSLEKNEKCNCPQSIRAREAKNKTQSQENTWQNDDNVYTTGYTQKDKKKTFERIKHMWNERKKTTSRGIKSAITGFLKDPVNSISTPRYLTPLQIAFLLLVTGMITACAGFLMGNMLNIFNRGFMAPVTRSYDIWNFLFTIVFGGVAICLGFFAVFFVFWLIDRFILKQRKSFFDFSTRLLYALIPFGTFGILGIIVGFFSVYALLMLVILGALMWVILTYEALKQEWNFISHSKALYLTAVGMLFIMIIIFNIL